MTFYRLYLTPVAWDQAANGNTFPLEAFVDAARQQFPGEQIGYRFQDVPIDTSPGPTAGHVYFPYAVTTMWGHQPFFTLVDADPRFKRIDLAPTETDPETPFDLVQRLANTTYGSLAAAKKNQLENLADEVKVSIKNMTNPSSMRILARAFCVPFCPKFDETKL